MDPATALGVIASVYTLAELGIKVAKIGQELSQTTDVFSSQILDAVVAAEEMEKLVTRLEHSDDGLGADYTELDDDTKELLDITRRCRVITKELKKELPSQLPSVEKRRRRDALWGSWETYWKSPVIEEHKAKLREFRDILSTRIIVGIREHFNDLEQSVHDLDQNFGCQFNQVESRIQQVANEIKRGKFDCNDRLDDIITFLEQSSLVMTSASSRYTSCEYTDPQALHNAARAGDMEAMQRLLRNQRTNIDGLDPVGRTALHCCTNASTAKMLIDWHARVNEQDFKGQTPLHRAVIDGHLEVVQALLFRRADISVKDYNGRTPLEYSKEHPAATFMLRNGPDVEAKDKTFLNNTGLFHMAWLGDQEGVEFYLAQGAMVDYRNWNNETCLAEAARHGDVDIARRLLEAGADIEAKQQGDCRPLLRAVTANRKEMVRELLLLGADPEARNKQQQQQHTAIAEAAFRKHWEVTRIPADFGVNLAARDCEGCTPLHRALQGSAPNLVQTLLAC